MTDPHELPLGPFSVDAQLNREFEASTELIEEVRRISEESQRKWKIRDGGLDAVFLATFGTATKTFRAVDLLCRQGFGQQAAMLNRSLFESAAVLWWCLSKDVDEVELVAALQDHHAHARILYERALADHRELKPEEHEPFEFDDAEAARLDKRFGRYGGNWHGKSVAELVREAELAIDDSYSSLLTKFFRFVNHQSNQFLHHSSYGLNDAMEWNEDRSGPVVPLGPSSDWVSAALFGGVWEYCLIVLACLRRFAPDDFDAFGELVDDTTRKFRSYTREEVREVGRNDPCPCGSGVKFKRCHLPVVRVDEARK